MIVKHESLGRLSHLASWLGVSVLSVLVAAGCSTPPNSGKSETKANPPAKAAPAAQPAATAAPADKAPAASEKPASGKPAGEKPAATDNRPVAGGKPGAEAKWDANDPKGSREELAKSIRERLVASGAKPDDQPPAKKPAAAHTPAAAPTAATSAPASQPTSGPAAKEGGCHGSEAPPGLVFPPPGGPQPKYVCKQPEIKKEDVWKGQSVTFAFEITNEGEGPLQVLLKGG